MLGDTTQEAMSYSGGGGALLIGEDAPKTLCAALMRTASSSDKGIVHVQPDGSAVFQSYAALLGEARRVLHGLRNAGLSRHDRAILQLTSLHEFFPAFWACVLGGITPVTVAVASRYDEQNSVVSKLLNVWKLLGRPAIVASETLISPIANMSGLPEGGRVELLSITALRNHPPAQEALGTDPNDIAFFQLSSGSTGVPKCIQETHRAVIAHIHASREFNGYSQDDVTLNWLAMDHVVPLLTFHVKDVYLGCQAVQAPTASVLANPVLWLDLIEQYGVTHTWSPNFGYKLVADALARTGQRTRRLSSLKACMNAGEQVTLPVVQAFLSAVAPFGVEPRVMQPAFGMAEVATCMTYQNNFDLKTGVHRFSKSSLGSKLSAAFPDDRHAIDFVDLGPPIPGVEIRIVNKNGELLAEGIIGRLQIKGSVLMPGYFDNAAANEDAFVGDGWFNTGDLGFILDGRLTITGREKEMIILYGANYYCHEIEDVVNRVDGVEPTYAAACGIADARTGSEELAIFFTSRHDDIDAHLSAIRAIRASVSQQLGVAPRYVVPLAKLAFPKTTSGKIQRTQLKARLAAGEFTGVLATLQQREASSVYAEPETDLERWLAGIWGEVLNVPRIGLHDDFLAYGGDSLKAMQIWGRLRDAFPVELPLERILLECSTVAKLAAVLEETLIEKLQTLSEHEAEQLMQAVPGVTGKTAVIES